MSKATRSRSGQHPDAVSAGKAKHQQPTQVDRGDPQRPPQVVAVDATVGRPSAAVGDQPGQRAFHHRPPAPIALLEAPGHRLAAGGAQLVLVRVEVDGPARLAVVQCRRSGHCWHQRAKLAWPELVIGAAWPAGHLTMPACLSIRKSWMVNPPGTALWSGMGLIVWLWPAARRAARVAPDAVGRCRPAPPTPAPRWPAA